MLQSKIDLFLTSAVNDLDNFIIEALERKGYSFRNRYELLQFIENNCKCVSYDKSEYPLSYGDYYFANDQLFFFYRPSNKVTSDNLTFNVTLGEYKFM